MIWIAAIVILIAFLRERSYYRGVCRGRDLAFERARAEAADIAHEWTTRGLQDSDESAVMIGEGAARVRNRIAEVIAEQKRPWPG